jgi:hypothetical protein
VQDFVTCLQLIEEQLRECNGLCEYPLYVKGEQRRIRAVLRRERENDDTHVLCGACVLFVQRIDFEAARPNRGVVDAVPGGDVLEPAKRGQFEAGEAVANKTVTVQLHVA